MVVGIILEHKINSLDKIWTYFVPENIVNEIKIGQRVKVNFNNQILIGFIVKIFNEDNFDDNINPIIEVLDSVSFIDNRNLNLIRYLEYEFLGRKIDYLNLFTQRLNLGKKIQVYKLRNEKNISALNSEQKVQYDKFGYLLENDDKLQLDKNFIIEEKRTRKNRYIVRCCSDEKFYNFFESVKKNKQLTGTQYLIENGSKHKITSKILSKSNLNKLLDENIVKLTTEHEFYDISLNFENKSKIDKSLKNNLTKNQQYISDNIDLNTFSENLIMGITGSGKTHIFIDLIQKVNKMGKIAYVLIPEVGLSYKIFEKLSDYIDKSYLFHYKVPQSYKNKLYDALDNNNVNLIVGTRSSLFINNQNIGLIIIDEEHDEDYYQNRKPIYDSMTICKILAKQDQFPIVYSSATPSFEVKSRCKIGEVNEYKLTETFSNYKNTYEVVKHVNNHLFLSDKVIYNINKALSCNEQSILLFNKKAFASSFVCNDCGIVDKCELCGTSRKVYVRDKLLKCNFCGSSSPIYYNCKNCGSSNLSYKGQGIEQVYEELSQIFDPNLICVIDGDILKKEKQRREIMEKIESNEFKIILGTQIISKGFDFKNITFGAVLDADNSLNLPCFDASEKTFQLLNQFIGRVGRHKKGHIILQTSDEKNPLWIQILESRFDEYFEQELRMRQRYYMPPFINISYIRINGHNYESIFKQINEMNKYFRDRFYNTSEIYAPYISKQGLNYYLEFKLTFSNHQKKIVHNDLLKFKNEFSRSSFIIAMNPRSWM